MYLMFIQRLNESLEEFEFLKLTNLSMPSVVDLIPRSLKKLQIYIFRKWALTASFSAEGLILVTDSFRKKESGSGKYVAIPAFDTIWNMPSYPLNIIKMNIAGGKLFNVHGIPSFLESLVSHIKRWSVFYFIETSLAKCRSEPSCVIFKLLIYSQLTQF